MQGGVVAEGTALLEQLCAEEDARVGELQAAGAELHTAHIEAHAVATESTNEGRPLRNFSCMAPLEAAIARAHKVGVAQDAVPAAHQQMEQLVKAEHAHDKELLGAQQALQRAL